MTQTAPSAALTPNSQTPFLNVAAYKFVPLEDREALRDNLKAACHALELRGTILLSPEGINLFLSGLPARVDEFLGLLRDIPGLQDLEEKRSYSKKVPFRRMLVRLKKEIIPCGMDSIRPEQKTSPKLPAKELKKWLDEGRPVRLLDVRNNYEIELGSFHGAEQLEIGHFREFPAAIEQLPEEAKTQPLVMFCTGGIRCEKAGPVMEQAGYQEVYQLDGGILKYFEECGSDHYDGSCFVFDGRVALDPALQPTGNLLCFACQAVLTAEDVTSGKFMFGQYCPRCYQPPETLKESEFEERKRRIRTVAEQQPGCQSYTNLRKIHVPGRLAGLPILDFLEQYQPGIAREQWEAWLDSGQIVGRDGVSCQPDRMVGEGETFVQQMPDTVEPAINPDIELVYEDENLVVINKPAPLPVHPSGRFNRNTLLWILRDAYPNQKLRAVHRLDAGTTGVTLLCRKYRPAKLVQQQFAERTVQKVYLARAQGTFEDTEFDCDAPISEGPIDRAGRREIQSAGQAAQTSFRVLQEFDDGTSLVEARPHTGRTHQIRLHLAHLGHAIVGDPLYGTAISNPPESRKPEATQAADPTPPLCLHSLELTLRHPESNELVTYRVPAPAWAKS